MKVTAEALIPTSSVEVSQHPADGAPQRLDGLRSTSLWPQMSGSVQHRTDCALKHRVMRSCSEAPYHPEVPSEEAIPIDHPWAMLKVVVLSWQYRASGLEATLVFCCPSHCFQILE